MVATRASLRDDIDEIMPGVIADRRHLHQHPELGFKEFETSKFVADRLRQLGRRGYPDRHRHDRRHRADPRHEAGLGPEKVVLLRADMDALPIHEQNEVEYKSVNQGVMHACGHDAHTVDAPGGLAVC